MESDLLAESMKVVSHYTFAALSGSLLVLVGITTWWMSHVMMDFLLYRLQDDQQDKHPHGICSLRAWFPVEPWEGVASLKKMVVAPTEEGAGISDGFLTLAVSSSALA